MTSAALCVLAFLVGLLGGSISLASGLGAVVGVGYLYGIVRANLPEPAAHFIFDAAVFGLYLAQLLRPVKSADRKRMRGLTLWVCLLIGWPLILLLVPIQHPLVQLVGFRGNVYLLPFLLLGARLTREDAGRLTLWLAGLNLMAFCFAVPEYILGIERFFPRNEVTKLLYLSRDVAGYKAYRIPACFSSSAAYGGTMAATVPWLVGAWAEKRRAPVRNAFLLLAFFATTLGVFLSASRSSAVVFGVLLGAFALTGGAGKRVWLGLLLIVPAVGYLVVNEERLQRFASLQDIDRVASRIEGSVNMSLLEAVVEHPLGNGLGGGGTSLPHFLQNLITERVVFENEYARIALELGLPGLALWVCFIVWSLTRPTLERRKAWGVARWLIRLQCAIMFAISMLGTGMMTAIPGTALWCIAVGWCSVIPRQEASRAPAPPRRAEEMEAVGAGGWA